MAGYGSLPNRDINAQPYDSREPKLLKRSSVQLIVGAVLLSVAVATFIALVRFQFTFGF